MCEEFNLYYCRWCEKNSNGRCWTSYTEVISNRSEIIRKYYVNNIEIVRFGDGEVECETDNLMECCLRPGSLNPDKITSISNECGYLGIELNGRLGEAAGFEKYGPNLKPRVGGKFIYLQV